MSDNVGKEVRPLHMREKEIAIIEAAIKLFASKGFDSTSIQEIATECGISKGAFYLYFKSKESLLLSIFRYYSDQIRLKIEEVEIKNLPPREQFVEQLVCQLREVVRHKEFIIMQSRELAIPFNKEVAEFIQSMRIETKRFFQKALLSIYGESIQPYIWDLSVMQQGMIHAYFEVIIFDHTEMDLDYLSEFILKRTDNLVEGLLDSGEPAVMTNDPLVTFLNGFTEKKEFQKDDLLDLLNDAKGIVVEQHLAEGVLVSLEVLEAEIKSDTPRTPVIQGMLATLNEEASMAELQQKIAEYFGVKLL
jgi:AcrR family transcriptional regulator